MERPKYPTDSCFGFDAERYLSKSCVGLKAIKSSRLDADVITPNDQDVGLIGGTDTDSGKSDAEYGQRHGELFRSNHDAALLC